MHVYVCIMYVYDIKYIYVYMCVFYKQISYANWTIKECVYNKIFRTNVFNAEKLEIHTTYSELKF